MPGYDQSGPMGNGPMSGGGRGICGSAAQQRDFTVSQRWNRGNLHRRRVRGKSAGGRFGQVYESFSNVPDGEKEINEKRLLEEQERALQESLTRIQQRLNEL